MDTNTHTLTLSTDSLIHTHSHTDTLIHTHSLTHTDTLIHTLMHAHRHFNKHTHFILSFSLFIHTHSSYGNTPQLLLPFPAHMHDSLFPRHSSCLHMHACMDALLPGITYSLLSPLPPHSRAQLLPHSHDLCQCWRGWLLVLWPQQMEWPNSGWSCVSLVCMDHGSFHCILIQGAEERFLSGSFVPGGSAIFHSLWPGALLEEWYTHIHSHAPKLTACILS